MSSQERRAAADRILREKGLLSRLEEIGRPHIIGSYRMDMMAWNDLDIDVENDEMTIDKLYALTEFVLKTFRPVWYEAKQEQNEQGENVWFHGFETMQDGQLWNVDLWFFNRRTIEQAEAYCDGVAHRADAAQRQAILDIKTELIARGLYSFEQFKSMDVYQAVLDQGVRDVESFLKRFGKKN